MSKWFLCAFAVLLVCPAEVWAQPVSSAQESAITRLLGQQQSRTRVPGIALVVRRHGQIVYARSAGSDGDGAPFTTATPVYLGSLSKSFTALAVMQLVSQRRIDLDRPVVTYLPEFVPQDPRGSTITVRHLLLQTSGLTDANLPDWTRPWPRRFAEATRRVQRVTTLASQPGTQHAYHNANYMLLADLVERVSGEPFADYLKHQVFEPLGMRTARSVNWMDEAADGVPLGHVFLFGHPLAVPAPAFFIGGAGGVIASAMDLSCWVEVFTHEGRSEDGHRLLPADVVARMLQPETDSRYQYQYGWVVRQPGTRLVRHNGGLPTFTAHAAFAPDDSLAIAVVINASPANPAWSEIGEDIADGIVTILSGGTPAFPSSRFGLVVEQVFALFSLLTLVLIAWQCMRMDEWRQRRRLVSGRAALYRLVIRALVLPGSVVLAILVALPAAVSFVESWSWLWLWYFSPAITGCLWLIAIAAAVLLTLRCRSLLPAGAGRGPL